jgi:DNA-binding PadR family transcriptional regulator
MNEKAIEELLRDGYIAAISAGRSYELTALGEEFLRRPLPPPLGYDEYLLPFQRSYLLLLLLKKGERTASLSDICTGLRTDNLQRVMGFGQLKADDSIQFNRPLVEWILDSLVNQKAIERIERGGRAASYRLLEAGRELLGASDQYERLKFTLLGKQLNDLLLAARMVGKATTPDVPPKRQEEPSRPTAAQILAEYERLKQERYSEHGMVPIHELRRVVANRFGAEAASHEVLDSLLKALRRERRLRLVAIGNAGDASQQQLDDSIHGDNEIYFMIEDVHEPASVG